MDFTSGDSSLISEFMVNITTHDMHTGGEPLRIIKSGLPELQGSTILEKRTYAIKHLDHFRKFLMNEPRGHKDMYGAILFKENPNEFGVLFMHNEGYSSMCGHAIIALGRYVIDFKLVEPVSPETEVIFNCPCGAVKAFVEYNNQLSGRVHFESVPAFVYKLDFEIDVPRIGSVSVDISYGGAFYAFITDKQVSLDLQTSSLSEIVETAGKITEAVKSNLKMEHPESKELSFLYGTIITDGKDKFSDGPSTNICIFADNQIDRSPTGSGVTARIALQWTKGQMQLNEEKEFISLIGSRFTGAGVRETFVGKYPAVVVRVSGMAYHTGDHTFYLENRDALKEGFQLPR
ncbi:trans-L-3-hydroxyproline dehydratase [Caerostris extrusa]|uniref:trans-L-3-hydroxyproline dehydratase n=1 Tax=Caerostris extrusa TaxID=172846 RepID=A0AAV4U669_CAEEX|nr:trans-L-3-hydroxyproline dehydratase [Caerostris extrusa]